MKGKFTLAIIITIISLGLTSCSEGPSVFFNDKINSFGKFNHKYNNDKNIYDSFGIKIINDIQSLHPDLEYMIDRSKIQRGYLTFKGSDFSYPDITLVFISSGKKNTGGYDIEVENIEKENNELNIVVKETTPSIEDDVIQVITYPYIIFTIEGEYDSFKIKDTDGNPFYPISMEDIDSSIVETKDLSEINVINKDIINKLKANILVRNFIDALNVGDSKKILDYLNPEMVGYYTTETVEAAISDYKVYFKNSPIIEYNWISDSNIPDFYSYELIGRSGKKLNVNVIYNEDAMWIESDFLDYSYQSKHLLERFIYALKKESKILLSQIFTIDDRNYPISNASKLIEIYKEHFDLESLEYEFIDIDSESQTFIYHITGEKNGEPVEHAIKIIYENKSVRLSDPWAPPY